MSDASGTTARGFSVWRLLLGILLGALGHGVAVGATFLAAAVVEPSAGGGFEDVAAAVGAFLLIEALVFIAVVIAEIRWLIKRRYDLALGLFLGWVAGPVVFFAQRLST
jgi:ACR3 family arsenite efflux pump ArsB